MCGAGGRERVDALSTPAPIPRSVRAQYPRERRRHAIANALRCAARVSPRAAKTRTVVELLDDNASASLIGPRRLVDPNPRHDSSKAH
jgi:hypothetical protein